MAYTFRLIGFVYLFRTFGDHPELVMLRFGWKFGKMEQSLQKHGWSFVRASLHVRRFNHNQELPPWHDKIN